MSELPDDLLQPAGEGTEEAEVGEHGPSEAADADDDAGIRGTEHLGLTPPD